MGLTAEPTVPAIHPVILERLQAKLHPVDFNRDSNLYDAGYEQAKRDIIRFLEQALNKPLPAFVPNENKSRSEKWWWQR